MIRKLTVLLMAALFSLSVAGLSYAQTKPGDKPADKPATKPADKPAAKPGDKPAANPCAAGEKTKKKATKKKTIKKKTTKKKMGEVPGPVEK
jgi:hypothetical protein